MEKITITPSSESSTGLLRMLDCLCFGYSVQFCLFVCLSVCLFVFWDRLLIHNPGWLQTHCLPTPDSQVLEFHVCLLHPALSHCFLINCSSTSVSAHSSHLGRTLLGFLTLSRKLSSSDLTFTTFISTWRRIHDSFSVLIRPQTTKAPLGWGPHSSEPGMKTRGGYSQHWPKLTCD